ncbi:venom serine protease 34 [Orussus abietinus]|uniref:venom serine protease 34 n=1 Tax=Orussus abietinus TaxID=222816 RepID=UPI000626BF0E|nr:venom serine protease 34 [Orussus abietinus]
MLRVQVVPGFLATVLLALLGVADAIDTDCDYYQRLELGKTYYVFNPDYPDNYSGPKSCRWRVTSPTRVRLSCQEFELPATRDCSGDRFTVEIPGSEDHHYCGRGNFALESMGPGLAVLLRIVSGSPGGRFLCTLQATQDDGENCECGWTKQTKIVGGEQTGVNEYPMMAGMVNSVQRLLYCGATIISNRHVITAAHCVAGRPFNQLAVLVGDHDLTTGAETNASKLLRVASYLVHPEYQSASLANDIAVVTVAENIVFSNEVGPACLPFHHKSDSFGGSKVVVLGWGTTEFAGASSNTLQKVILNVTSLPVCRRDFQEVTSNQICTYSSGKDSCQFDSGGPVLWQDPSSMRMVSVGIISYGGICASEKPGVNTRVGAYLDWILSVTPGMEYCRAE